MKTIKQFVRFIFSQKATIILLLLAQFAFIIFTFFNLSAQFAYLNIVFTIIGLALTIYILNQHTNPAYKLVWIIPLLAMPLFATVAYFILVNQYGTKKLRQAHLKKRIETRPFLMQDEKVAENLMKDNKNVYKLANYVNKYGSFPVYQNTTVDYFRSGEEMFAALKAELKKAKRFIFLEYFIVANGEMWAEIEDILVEKVQQGVDVRMLYDGMVSRLKYRYDKKLREKGIKCYVYNPFRPMISTIQNNRDHRKIVVIDGHTAFNGGNNIADEYINKIVRFGYWKDTAVMLKGDAVWNFTMMFLQMWEIVSKKDFPTNYDKFRLDKKDLPAIESDGFVMTYGDSPLDDENVGEMVYLDIINNAKDYVYITTPYLLIDNELVTALGYAAKSGVDVKIIVPEIPDKWYIKSIGWSYYRELMELGVKIYEYHGFMHAKSFISDDMTAVVGTINLDFRSLYMHFECATYMYNMPCIADVKQDFADVLKNKCRELTVEDCINRPLVSRMTSAILRTFAPLL
ncbi:MAG: cardiolipin synthase [Ruminococcus sp.]|nr:cardiolipin synthase [Ruminococcus sp.]